MLTRRYRWLTGIIPVQSCNRCGSTTWTAAPPISPMSPSADHRHTADEIMASKFVGSSPRVGTGSSIGSGRSGITPDGLTSMVPTESPEVNPSISGTRSAKNKYVSPTFSVGHRSIVALTRCLPTIRLPPGRDRLTRPVGAGPLVTRTVSVTLTMYSVNRNAPDSVGRLSALMIVPRKTASEWQVRREITSSNLWGFGSASPTSSTNNSVDKTSSSNRVLADPSALCFLP
jgi:hypothetical protein